jgi:hypothetical protein
MSRKRARLEQKLDPGMHSWEDQVAQSRQAAAPPPPEPELEESGDKLQRKTFLITPVLIDRINRMAKSNSVGQNELVRYLLNLALEQIESGSHKLPLKPRYTIES